MRGSPPDWWKVRVPSSAPIAISSIARYAEIASTVQAVQLAFGVGICFVGAILLTAAGPKFTLRLHVNPSLIWIFVALFSFATYGYVAATSGLRIQLEGLTNVRSVRLGYRETVAGAGLLGYFVTLQAYVVNPLLMARGLFKRRAWLFLLGVFGQVLLYSLAGHKMSILSPMVMVLIAAVYRYRSRLAGPAVLYGVLAVVIVSTVLDRLFPASHISFVFVQRLLVMPGALTSAWVDAFDGREKANFGDVNVIRWFVDSPYSQTQPFIVGSWFSGDSQSSANANFFADGFGNFGYVGMAIETMLFVVILWMLNATLRYLPMPIVLSLLALPTLALSNAAAFTSIFSHGMGLVMALGMVLPRTGWGRSKSPQDDGAPRPGIESDRLVLRPRDS